MKTFTKWMIQPAASVLLKGITDIYNFAFDCTGILGGRHSSPRNKMVAGAVPKSTGSGMSWCQSD